MDNETCNRPLDARSLADLGEILPQQFGVDRECCGGALRRRDDDELDVARCVSRDVQARHRRTFEPTGLDDSLTGQIAAESFSEVRCLTPTGRKKQRVSLEGFAGCEPDTL
jgi:hypothetical protein